MFQRLLLNMWPGKTSRTKGFFENTVGAQCIHLQHRDFDNCLPRLVCQSKPDQRLFENTECAQCVHLQHHDFEKCLPRLVCQGEPGPSCSKAQCSTDLRAAIRCSNLTRLVCQRQTSQSEGVSLNMSTCNQCAFKTLRLCWFARAGWVIVSAKQTTIS